MTHVDLMRPAPGVVRCCICFQAWPVDRMWVDAEGVRWDVCPPCALAEHLTVATMPCHDHDQGRFGNWYEWVPYPGETVHVQAFNNVERPWDFSYRPTTPVS